MNPEGNVVELNRAQRAPIQETVAGHIGRQVNAGIAERYQALAKSVSSFHKIPIEEAWKKIRQAEGKWRHRFFDEKTALRNERMAQQEVQRKKIQDELQPLRDELDLVSEQPQTEAQQRSIKNLVQKIQWRENKLVTLWEDSIKEEPNEESRAFNELRQLELINELGMVTSAEQKRLTALREEWKKLQEQFGVSASVGK